MLHFSDHKWRKSTQVLLNISLIFSKLRKSFELFSKKGKKVTIIRGHGKKSSNQKKKLRGTVAFFFGLTIFFFQIALFSFFVHPPFLFSGTAKPCFPPYFWQNMCLQEFKTYPQQNDVRVRLSESIIEKFQPVVCVRVREMRQKFPRKWHPHNSLLAVLDDDVWIYLERRLGIAMFPSCFQ